MGLCIIIKVPCTTLQFTDYYRLMLYQEFLFFIFYVIWDDTISVQYICLSFTMSNSVQYIFLRYNNNINN